MENIVLDMADLNAGVFCCWSVLQQRLEPKNNNNKNNPDKFHIIFPIDALLFYRIK